MFRKVSALVFSVCLVILAAGCDLFKNPVGPSDGNGRPSPKPTPRTFTVVSGETFQPVRGARVGLGSVDENSPISDFEGKVTLENVQEHGKHIFVRADGFLEREFNVFSGTKDEITLWPDRPGFESQFTKELLYGRERLVRPIGSRLIVKLSEQLLQEPRVVEVHQRAVRLLSDAFNGHIRLPEVPMVVELAETNVQSQDVFGLILTVSIDPNAVTGVTTGFRGDEINFASLVYPSMVVSTQITIVLRMLAWSTGLGPTFYPGIMNRERPSGADFSDAEKLAMRLSLLRRPGNKLLDLGQ